MTEHSPYEEVELPEFKSQIPEALLKDANDSTRWIMNTLSRQTQILDFLCVTVVHQSRNLKQTDEKAIIAAAGLQELKEEVKAHGERIKNLEEAKARYEKNSGNGGGGKNKFTGELRDFMALLSWRPFQIFLVVLIIFGALLGPSGLAAIGKFLVGLL